MGVNCSGVEVQAIGSVPSFAVDKCSTIQLVLSEACLKAEVVSAKSDQINVVLPPENAQADILELAVPEQIKTVVEGRALKSFRGACLSRCSRSMARAQGGAA